MTPDVTGANKNGTVQNISKVEVTGRGLLLKKRMIPVWTRISGEDH